ncbi:MAG: hypothetical protein HYW01_01280 [Deltaproteobacteria bacterium]|nr:hypothetical protein [Deltaproteobacteria bacterium]
MLEYFNGFYDGFVKRVELLPHDRFEETGPWYFERGHLCTGQFDVVIDIAHYNYGQGDQPSNRLVSCHFQDFKDFCLDLRGNESYEWESYLHGADALKFARQWLREREK